jgi:5-methylcytosine-specific restriction protein B
MNYWHIQLHPDIKLSTETLISILKTKKVIGLGEDWNDKNGKPVPDPTLFKNEMQTGDIVLVRNTIKPVALVQVEGNPFIEKTIKEDFDWFKLRRKIKIVEIFDGSHQQLLDEVLKKYDSNHIQAPGTLTKCQGNNATNDFIREWYKIAIRRTLMENIKLSSERQSEIKNMWIKFTDKFTDKDKSEANDKAQKLSSDWQQYRTKIEDGTLNLDEYTNRKDADTATMPGSYMCNFLERDTKTVFGSSKPGNSNNFEIKLNSDGKTYTIRTELKQGDKGENKNDLDKSLLYFNNHVMPILDKIVKTPGSREKVDAVENSNYAAKQVLRKMAVLDKTGEFLFIYSDNIIDTLHAEFVGSDEATNLGKNHEIRLVANEILNLDKDDVVESILLS